jgi:hypothetical protein
MVTSQELATLVVEADSKDEAYAAVQSLLNGKTDADPQLDLDWDFLDIEDLSPIHVGYIGETHDDIETEELGDDGAPPTRKEVG